MRFKFLGVPAAVLLCLSLSAHAQDYPASSKPITFVLPYAAGGPTDKAARDLAQSMSKALGGHSIVIENAPGASGVTTAPLKSMPLPGDARPPPSATIRSCRI